MPKSSPRKTLVVAAHPDDEVLGCGATIAKHVAYGDVVWVLILGQGVMARKGFTFTQKKMMQRRLRAAAGAASRALGVERLILKSFPDNKFDSVALLRIVQTIEETLNLFKPTLVYTHHHADVNIDHRLTAEAVEAATRPTRESSVERVLAFEVPSSTEWNFIKKSVFRPNVFVKIDKKSLQEKIRAMKKYKSEIRLFPHPRSPEYIRALATVRGGQIGFSAAEAFSLVFSRE